MRVLRLRDLGLLSALLIACTAPSSRAQAPAAPPAPAASPSTAPSRDDIVNALAHYDAESALELDLPALKQKALEQSRSRSKKEPEPSKRPPVVPELKGLPTFNFNIQFDVDTPIVEDFSEPAPVATRPMRTQQRAGTRRGNSIADAISGFLNN